MTNQHSNLSCDEFAGALPDLLDHALPDAERSAMESHAAGCPDCGPLLADLRALRADAANLPVLAPSRDLWAGIEARIETPVVEIGRVGAPVWRHRRTAWTAVAAAALVGVTATTTYLLTRRAAETPVARVATVAAVTADSAARVPRATLSSPAKDSSAVAAPSTAPASTGARTAARGTVSLASNRPSAEATLDSEIGRLRRIVDRRRGDLDSSTVAVLETNLSIIDHAIAQCRAALKKDPASAYLNESLTDALDNKVQLLRAAAGLPARM